MDVERFIAANKSRFESLLKEFVEIPTVSMEPERKPDILRCADRAVALLKATGLRAGLVGTNGNPVVFGEYIGDPSWKTMLLYNHLDVQPADPSEWVHPPFQFLEKNGRYFGRGTTDDKGPALSAFLAIEYAILNKIPLNFQIVWELEEEISSKNFEQFFKANPLTLKPDSILVSDGLWVSKDQPSSEYGLRGNVGLIFKLVTGEKDVHSGETGGLARNPAGELCQVISACYDPKTGRVAIPGFYDKVRPTSEEEVKGLLATGFNQKTFISDHELRSVRQMSDTDAVKALKTLPTFEVTGFHSGYGGEGIKTIVPYRAEAKISLRIVPYQMVEEVARLVTEFIRKINPDVEVSLEKGLAPYLADPKGPHCDALQRAVKSQLGKECVFDRAGGSIGAVDIMARHLKVPIIFFGLSLPEHGYHAKNEYFDWQQAESGMKVFSAYFREIAKL